MLGHQTPTQPIAMRLITVCNELVNGAISAATG
jgi:hypothetical protein